MVSTITVTITGAAGRIAYSLIPLILRGQIFGINTRINLHLLDITEAMGKLHGLSLEIDDSNYELLDSLVCTSDAELAFEGADVAILLGGFPRLPGMERRDLLLRNAESIKFQALALNKTANKDVKVVVVANPANTNCLVAIKTATSIPASNFTCLTRLDEERLRGFVAKKVALATNKVVLPSSVENVFIFGNHSTTQVPYIGAATTKTQPDGCNHNAIDYFNSDEYQALIHKVQNRGSEIIKATQFSSALSAAEAVVKHLADWLGPSKPTSAFSMGVLTSKDNGYGIASNIVYSLPCARDDTVPCGYSVLHDLQISEYNKQLLELSAAELLREKADVAEYMT